ncbi:sulfotransferase family 2 domain-containing protein [Calditrichota bacterium GD2]
MFYSRKYNLLFIAIPKTGTKTVEDVLSKIDPNGEKFSITTNEKKFVGKDFQQGILGHARAKEIRKVIGLEFYDSLNTITFVRDPLEKLVSAYFFNKANPIMGFRNFKGKRKLFLRKLKYFVSVLMAKILPFYLWCFFYPYKSNYDYIYNDEGQRLVKYIGRTDYLESDLIKILSKIGIDNLKIAIDHLNKSKHKEPSAYYKNKIFKNLVELKVKKDIKLYKLVKDEINNM